MWSKPLLCRFRQSGEIPQTQVSQGFAAFHIAPPGYRHGTPKADVLPTGLCPDIRVQPLRYEGGERPKLFCRWLRSGSGRTAYRAESADPAKPAAAARKKTPVIWTVSAWTNGKTKIIIPQKRSKARAFFKGEVRLRRGG